jgi:hypothetical protein
MTSSLTNKRLIAIVALALLIVVALTVTLISVNKKQPAELSYDETISLDVDHLTYESRDELEDDAEYIFVGTVQGGGRASLEKARPADDLNDPNPFTEYTLKIDKIFKGTIPDKTITFRQLGGVKNNKLYKVEGYTQLRSGERYVFFAIKGEDNKYGALAGGHAVAPLAKNDFTLPSSTGIPGPNITSSLSSLE